MHKYKDIIKIFEILDNCVLILNCFHLVRRNFRVSVVGSYFADFFYCLVVRMFRIFIGDVNPMN